MPKRDKDVFLYCFLPVSLIQDISLNLELTISWLGWQLASPCDLPISTHIPSTVIIGVPTTLCFLHGCWGSELWSSCLGSKCSYQLSHLPNMPPQVCLFYCPQSSWECCPWSLHPCLCVTRFLDCITAGGLQQILASSPGYEVPWKTKCLGQPFLGQDSFPNPGVVLLTMAQNVICGKKGFSRDRLPVLRSWLQAHVEPLLGSPAIKLFVIKHLGESRQLSNETIPLVAKQN